MTDYKTFCNHYDLDYFSEDSKKQYEDYKINLIVLEGIKQEQINLRPQEKI